VRADVHLFALWFDLILYVGVNCSLLNCQEYSNLVLNLILLTFFGGTQK